MAEKTGILWTDSTFNPWIGCAKVSPGCDHCYAEVSTPSRTMRVVWGPQEMRRRTSAGNWNLPRRWNAAHAEFYAQHGRRRRVFCASLADVFDNRADESWRADLWALVRETPHLDWLILTKRIGNVAAMLPADWGCGYGNVWLGISVVNQAEADRDIPKLLRLPAAVRWLSMEPLLGPVSLRTLDLGDDMTLDSLTGFHAVGMVIAGGLAAVPNGLLRQLPSLPGAVSPVDWVVVGGESGEHARPMDPAWAADLRDQCAALGVPFFYKQRGGRDKDKGGCLLDGQEAKAWPVAA